MTPGKLYILVYNGRVAGQYYYEPAAKTDLQYLAERGGKVALYYGDARTAPILGQYVSDEQIVAWREPVFPEMSPDPAYQWMPVDAPRSWDWYDWVVSVVATALLAGIGWWVFH